MKRAKKGSKKEPLAPLLEIPASKPQNEDEDGFDIELLDSILNDIRKDDRIDFVENVEEHVEAIQVARGRKDVALLDEDDSTRVFFDYIEGQKRNQSMFEDGVVNVTSVRYRSPILEESFVSEARRMIIPSAKEIKSDHLLRLTTLIKRKYPYMRRDSTVLIEIDTNLEANDEIPTVGLPLGGEIIISTQILQEFDKKRSTLAADVLMKGNRLFLDIMRNYYDCAVSLLHPGGYGLFKATQVLLHEGILSKDHGYNRVHRDMSIIDHYPTEPSQTGSRLIENVSKVLAALSTRKGQYLNRIFSMKVGKNSTSLDNLDEAGNPPRFRERGNRAARYLNMTLAYASQRHNYPVHSYNVVSHNYDRSALSNFDKFVENHRIDPTVEMDEDSFLVEFLKNTAEKDGISAESVYITYTLIMVLLSDVEIFPLHSQNRVSNMGDELMKALKGLRFSPDLKANLFFKSGASIHLFCFSVLEVVILAQKSLIKHLSFPLLFGGRGLAILNNQLLFRANEDNEIIELVSKQRTIEDNAFYVTEELNLTGWERSKFSKRKFGLGGSSIQRDRNIQACMIRTRKIPTPIATFYRSSSTRVNVDTPEYFLTEIISSYLREFVLHLDNTNHSVLALSFTPILLMSVFGEKIREMVEFGALAVFWSSSLRSNLSIEKYRMIINEIKNNPTFFDKKVHRGLAFIRELVKVIEELGKNTLSSVINKENMDEFDPTNNDPDNLINVRRQFKHTSASRLTQILNKYNCGDLPLAILNHPDTDSIRVVGNTYRALTTRDLEIGQNVYMDGNEEIGSGSFASLSSFLCDMIENKLDKYQFNELNIVDVLANSAKINFRVENIPFYNISANIFHSSYSHMIRLRSATSTRSRARLFQTSMSDELLLWEQVQLRFRTVNNNMSSDEFNRIISSSGREYYDYESAMSNFYSTDFINILAQTEIFSHNMPIQKKKDYFQCSNTIVTSAIFRKYLPIRVEIEYFDTVGIPCVYKSAWYTKMSERHNTKSIRELYRVLLEKYIFNDGQLGVLTGEDYKTFCIRKNCFSVVDLPSLEHFDQRILQLLITGQTTFGDGESEQNENFRYKSMHVLSDMINFNEELQREYNEERTRLMSETVIINYNGGFFQKYDLFPCWIDVKKPIVFLNVGNYIQNDYLFGKKIINAMRDSPSDEVLGIRLEQIFELLKDMNRTVIGLESRMLIIEQLSSLCAEGSNNLASFIEWLEMVLGTRTNMTCYFYYKKLGKLLIGDWDAQNKSFTHNIVPASRYLEFSRQAKYLYAYKRETNTVKSFRKSIKTDIRDFKIGRWNYSVVDRVTLIESPYVYEIDNNHITPVKPVDIFTSMFKTFKNERTFSFDYIFCLSNYRKEKLRPYTEGSKVLRMDKMYTMLDALKANLEKKKLQKSFIPDKSEAVRMKNDQFRTFQHIFLVWDIESYVQEDDTKQIPYIVSLICYNHFFQNDAVNLPTEKLSDLMDTMMIYKKSFIGENCLDQMLDHLYVTYLSQASLNKNLVPIYSFNGAKYDHILLIERLIWHDIEIIGNGINDLRSIDVRGKVNKIGFNSTKVDNKKDSKSDENDEEERTTPSLKFIDFLCLNPCGGLKIQCKKSIKDPRLQKLSFPFDDNSKQFLEANIERAVSYCQRDSTCLAALILIFRNNLNQIQLLFSDIQAKWISTQIPYLVDQVKGNPEAKTGCQREANEDYTRRIVYMIEKLHQQLGGKTFLTQVSAAGVAFSLFKEYVWRPILQSRTDAKGQQSTIEGIVGDVEEMLEVVIKSYTGGNCGLAIRHGLFLKGYDINSAYPYAMNECLPINIFIGFIPFSGKPDLWDIKIYNMYHIKSYVFPFIPQSIYPLPVRGTMKNTMKVGAFYPRIIEDLWVWGFELIKIHRVLNKNFNIRDPLESLDVDRIMLNDDKLHTQSTGYRSKNLHKSEDPEDPRLIMKTYVDVLYSKKAEYSESDDPMKNVQVPFIKLLLNSLYGKFGQKHHNTNIYGVSMGYAREMSPDYVKFQNYGIGSERGKIQKLELVNPRRGCGDLTRIAAFITARSRMRLWSFMMRIIAYGGRIYYWDTDSIITDIDLEAIPELAGKIHKTRLGAFKFEKDIEEGFFILPKFYTLVKKGRLFDDDVQDNDEEKNIENILYKTKGIRKTALNLKSMKQLLVDHKASFLQDQFVRQCGSVFVNPDSRKDIKIDVFKRKFKDDNCLSEEFSDSFENEEEFNNYLEGKV